MYSKSNVVNLFLHSTTMWKSTMTTRHFFWMSSISINCNDELKIILNFFCSISVLYVSIEIAFWKLSMIITISRKSLKLKEIVWLISRRFMMKWRTNSRLLNLKLLRSRFKTSTIRRKSMINAWKLSISIYNSSSSRRNISIW